jgi:hypothetical protein
MQSQVQVTYRYGVGLGPLKAVQGRESTSLKPTPHRYMTCTCDCIYSFNAFLMMGADSTRNMLSNFAVNNKDDCLKLHHVGYLINRAMMHGTTNIKFSSFKFPSFACHINNLPPVRFLVHTILKKRCHYLLLRKPFSKCCFTFFQ